MRKVSLSKMKTEVKKIKKRSWFRPISWLLMIVIIILLVLSSASVARISSQKRRAAYYNYNLESASSEGSSAYDFFEDQNKSNNTRGGLMVTLGNLYNKVAKNTDREVTVFGDEENGSFYQGSAGTLEQMEKRIRENVLAEMESHYSKVIEGATGKDGEAGPAGEQGEKGDRGSIGAVGKTGAAGQSGSVGATGATGETGPAGMDGLSTFIAYADNADGANMGATPKETSKYIGTYQGTIRSSDPKDYSWTEYKDKIITYENNGKPTLKIYN